MRTTPSQPRRRFTRSASLALLAPTTVLALVACVQMPTEKRGVADLRAQLSFQLRSDRARRAIVIVDGLESGRAVDYAEGEAALRVLPGTHRLQLVAEGATLLDERIYVGDGVHRSFIVQ